MLVRKWSLADERAQQRLPPNWEASMRDDSVNSASVTHTDTPPLHGLRQLRNRVLRLDHPDSHRQAQARLAEWRALALAAINRRLRGRLSEAMHAAYHDALTGLPNRRLFQDRLTLGMAQADRLSEPLALLMLDLDDFKQVNDQLGHHAGDALLRQIAERLAQCTRDADTLCRYGGDEFIVMLQNITGAAGVACVKDKIHEALARPYDIEGHQVRIQVSIGIAVYPGDARTDQGLYRQADAAMYMAKHGRSELRHAADSRQAIRTPA
jgi:diguanylate cyclase (GGDEF)-like protein